MNLEEHYNDPTYRKEVVSNLIENAKIMVLSKFCYYVCIEMALSNPYRDRRYDLQFPPSNCSFCPTCRGESIVPKVNRIGLTKVIFAANPNMADGMGPFTLDFVTTKIREYPQANFLILRSRAQGGIAPASIHQVLMILRI